MADKYGSLEELMNVEKEGIDYRIRWDDRHHEVTVIGPHGGKIEPGTSDVADCIAGTDWNTFLFEGIKRTKNLTLHVTSTRFRHPNLVEPLKRSRVALSVHGKVGARRSVALGGMNDGLIELILQELLAAGIAAEREADWRLSAREPGNVVNLARERGVQLELTSALRRKLCGSLTLMRRLGDAVRGAWTMTRRRELGRQRPWWRLVL